MARGQGARVLLPRRADGGDAAITTPPDDLPRYRLLTGPDDEVFCRRVSAALDMGYELYGPPCITFDGERVIVAQAVLWPGRATAAKMVPEVTADGILVLQEQGTADDTGPVSPGP